MIIIPSLISIFVPKTIMMDRIKSSRTLSLNVINLTYLSAIFLGIFSFYIFDELDVILRLFVSDLVATVFVWLSGVMLSNSSVYDPYWSVAPPIMLTGYAYFCGTWSIPVILMLVAIWYWAIRLTGNWAYTFQNLNKQDWRYDMYKEKFPRMWHIVNFAGINLMPTVIVFLAMAPGFLLIEKSMQSGLQADVFTWLGFAVCVSAATLQLISDTQAHRFRRNHKGEVCTTGLWSRSRHPNYLGEILMWWGIYLIYLTGLNEMNTWKDILIPTIGAFANTCLFIFISIPMMEKRQLANKPAYAEYRKNVRMLI